MEKTAIAKISKPDIYNLPTYSIAEASRYLHIPAPTLRTWVTGRSYPTKTGVKQSTPLILRPDSNYGQLSFTNLVEAHMLRVIRTVHNVPLDKVRKALDYISKELKTEHPLVEKQFRTDGVDLFIEQFKYLVNASRSGQLVMKQVLNNLLNRIEWDERNIAARLFPFTEPNERNSTDKILTIDPNISFGKSTITGTGVPTKIVTELYDAGDSLEDIAADYNCTEVQVKIAILFESNLQAS